MIGVSFGFHDAAVSAIGGDQILFAAQSERYTRVKNDPWLAHLMIMESYEQYGADLSNVAYYENPTLKGLRQWWTGEPRPMFGVHEHISKTKGLRNAQVTMGNHHRSHAAAGFYTSPWTEAAIIVVDAIGEFDCISVWKGQGRKLKKVWSQRYPHSLGLLYSAFTQRVGLKPNEHEYILMGMAPYGQPNHIGEIIDMFEDPPNDNETGWGFRLNQNVHKGIGNFAPDAKHEDLAASIQWITELTLKNLFEQARMMTGMTKVCYQGGVSLNCTANAMLLREGIFDDMWIMPNPGDAGASLGAALDQTREFVEFKTPFLGTNIDRIPNPQEIVYHLKTHGVAGLATGRAEFGPRSLGGRSLLADPRKPVMQNRVNDIKRREKFRPFAPIVLQEYADEYFDTMGGDMRYMQYAVRCKKPDEIPAVVHVDGTSRVQVVNPDTGPIYGVLKEWHRQTGCPVLLNTSLNIKGKPIVNDLRDAGWFTEDHGVTVF